MDQPEKNTASRSGWWIFTGLVLVFGGAIAATALLANNQKNLVALKQYLGIKVPEISLQRPAPTTKTSFKGNRLKGMTVELPSELVSNILTPEASAFHRRVYMKAEALCKKLQDKGLSNGGWQPSPLDLSVHECWAEINVFSSQDAKQQSTFFFMMKSDLTGTVKTARMKIVIASDDNSLPMRQHMADATDVFVEATGWTEFREMRSKIMGLEPFKIDNFGASMTFTKEFSGEGRYNLIFSLSAKDPAAKKTSAYFDQDRYLPLPAEVFTSPETFLKSPS